MRGNGEYHLLFLSAEAGSYLRPQATGRKWKDRAHSHDSSKSRVLPEGHFRLPTRKRLRWLGARSVLSSRLLVFFSDSHPPRVGKNERSAETFCPASSSHLTTDAFPKKPSFAGNPALSCWNRSCSCGEPTFPDAANSSFLLLCGASTFISMGSSSSCSSSRFNCEAVSHYHPDVVRDAHILDGGCFAPNLCNGSMDLLTLRGV